MATTRNDQNPTEVPPTGEEPSTSKQSRAAGVAANTASKCVAFSRTVPDSGVGSSNNMPPPNSERPLNERLRTNRSSGQNATNAGRAQSQSSGRLSAYYSRGFDPTIYQRQALERNDPVNVAFDVRSFRKPTVMRPTTSTSAICNRNVLPNISTSNRARRILDMMDDTGAQPRFTLPFSRIAATDFVEPPNQRELPFSQPEYCFGMTTDKQRQFKLEKMRFDTERMRQITHDFSSRPAAERKWTNVPNEFKSVRAFQTAEPTFVVPGTDVSPKEVPDTSEGKFVFSPPIPL